MICIKQFEVGFTKWSKKCNFIWELHPIPTIHKDLKSKPSFLWSPDLARKSRKKRKVEVDELTLVRASDKIFDINYISTDNAPDNYSFKRLDIIVHFPNLIFNEETFALAHHKCISIDCYFQICSCQDRSWHYLF